MATIKSEVETAFERCEIWHRDSTYPDIFDYARLRNDSIDVGRLPKFNVAAIETGSGGSHLEFQLLVNVCQYWLSDMVVNMGVAVGSSRVHCVQ